MAGAGVDQEELQWLRAQHDATMAVMRRVFDATSEDGRSLSARVLSEGQSLLAIDALNRILDELEHLRLARTTAVARLREGGDHYAAAIVEGLA